MKEKPSLYLLDKCENLEKVLNFFRGEKGSFNSPGIQKRLVFLAQIDFWDWEMDELIYSVSSFDERSKVWLSSLDLVQALGKEGMMIKNAVLEKITWITDRHWDEKKVTVAPVERLNQVIDKWNKLLNLCEESLFDKQVKNAVELGANFKKDLSKFKKTPL